LGSNVPNGAVEIFCAEGEPIIELNAIYVKRGVVPGYSSVLAGLDDLDVVGDCAAHAGLPALKIGLGHGPRPFVVQI